MEETELTEQKIVDGSEKVQGLRVLFILAVASFVEFVSAAQQCNQQARTCTRTYAFAVAIGIVTTALSVLLFIVGCTRAGTKNIFNQIFSVLMLILWSAGAGIMTFNDPFTTVGNGYFASWLSFWASVYLVFLSVPIVRRISISLHSRAQSIDSHLKAAMVVLVSSVIELVSGVVICQSVPNCPTYRNVVWVMFVGVASIFFSLMFILLSSCVGRVKVLFPVLLVALWVPGCGVGTFNSPFQIAGNGYFSSWTSLFVSVYWLTLCFPGALGPMASGSKVPA